MRARLLLGVPISAAAAVVAMSLTPAYATHTDDPPRGKSEMGPQHANSECSFSGLNDHETADDTGQVQSYGQGLKAGFAEPGYNAGGRAVPGFACNGHLSPYPPPDE